MVPHVLYYYLYSELRLLLATAGFTVEAVYGDPEFGPYEEGCQRMIVLARPV